MFRRHPPLNLALQGGGSHGAFTWGVLDRLLEWPALRIGAISGCSSGAINAAVLSQGLMEGGTEGARRALEEFWRRVGAQFSSLFGSTGLHHGWPYAQPDVPVPVTGLLRLTRDFSPYQLNPLGHNPLRGLLDDSIDFESLRDHSPVKLFCGATQVRTGKLRVFETGEITIDVLMASACLPSLHHAVYIDGEPYWDGGYTGNPPVFPLIFDCAGDDLLVIVVQPLTRAHLPVTADEIHNRTQELGFSSAFLREMRAIAMSKQQIGRDWRPRGNLERRLHGLRLHVIEDGEALARMDGRSRINSLPAFTRRLHKLGRAATDDWLERNSDCVGTRSSVDLEQTFI